MAYQILLIDDDTTFRDEFREYFHDVSVIEASSGKEARDILKKPNDIDLIILDEMLRNERGTEILPFLRQAAPDLDIILLTGYSSKDTAVDALRVHAADYLEKPLDQKKYKIIRSHFTSVPRNGDGSFSNGLKGKIEWVKRYLKKNYDKKVTLSDVAGNVCWSRKYLSRIFKEYIGMSFSEYKLNIKIEKAKEWLKDQGRTIDQISLKLGYENPDSFIKIFKKFSGCTPSEYRKRIQKDSAADSKVRSAELPVADDMIFNSGDAIIEMSSGGLISGWSPGAEKLYGWSSNEVDGKLIYDFIPRYLRKDTRDLFKCLRLGKIITGYESERLTKAGKILYVRVTLKPLYDKKGRLRKIVHFEHDISFQKEEIRDFYLSKEKMRGLTRIKGHELEKAMRVDLDKLRYLADIGRLAAMVAHELRNPIGVIETAVWNIRRKNTNPDLERNLKSIEKKVDESIEIINSLLNYSRIQFPEFKKISIAAILDHCVDSVNKRFLHRKSLVHKDLERVKTLKIYADPAHITKVFKNLIVNSYQALQGVHKARIDLRGEIEDNRVFVYLQDNGPGIKKENLERVFDLFFTERSGGTGVGLAVAKQIVEMHNGTIDIQSEKGKGVLITVTLPVA